MTIKHNKYKNTGILFELLVRQVAADVLSGVSNSRSISIIENFFSKDRELGKELMLYRSFFGTKKLSETKALDFIGLLAEQRKKLDNKRLKEERYNLVRELKDTYDLTKFLSMRVPSYKIYASIYKNFETVAQGYTFDNVQELSEAKYTLVEFLAGTVENKKQIVESDIQNTLKKQEEDLRLLTVELMFEKFNKKYDSLNPKQKELLRYYLNGELESNKILEFYKKEASNLESDIRKKTKYVKNEVQAIKLNEVANQLKQFGSLKYIKNNHLTALMIGYELQKQLESFQSHE